MANELAIKDDRSNQLPDKNKDSEQTPDLLKGRANADQIGNDEDWQITRDEVVKEESRKNNNE